MTLLNTIILRKVPALMYSSHSTTVQFLLLSRSATVSVKSRLIPERDEGNTAPPSLTNNQKNNNQKGLSSRVNLVCSSFDFAPSTVILSRQLTIAISHIQYPTRSTDTTRRQQYIPCSTPSADFTREPRSLTGTGGFLLHFLRWEVIYFCSLFPCVVSFLSKSIWGFFLLASLTDIYSVFM
jgi:hypothetical protein